MALIGTLRDRMGVWVVVFVFVAIAAFILGDLLGNNSSLFTPDHVGEIAGNTITLKEYQDALREQEMNYAVQFNRQPGEREKALMENQAWEALIVRNAIEKEYEKLGVMVPSEELWDMVQGKNVDEGLKSAEIFQNEAGQFDRDRVVQFLKSINDGSQQTAEDRFRWEMYQQNMAKARQRIKYENLLIKSAYVTTAQAEREYHVQNDVAEAKYLYVPYYAISDSSAVITDADLKKHYDENKERYKTEMSRDISYVAIPVVPSSYDSLDYRERLERIAAEFKTASNDSLFATGASDDPASAYQKYTPSSLPAVLSSRELNKGDVIGPVVDGNAYKVFKVSDLAPVAQARHILVRWTDESNLAKAEARDKANRILNELKAGADFATKARAESEDTGSGQNGGDLGWFSEGDMVKPFNDAVFNATKTGLVRELVESQFGYHIIDVTETKTNKGFVIASVKYDILPSDASINDALRKAENFQAGISGVAEFRERAKAEGLNVLDANNIKASDRRIGILGDVRQIVRWMFGDADVGDVSEVFDLNDRFVVAVITKEQEEGYRSLADVKDEITPAVKNKVKGRMITERLKGLTGTLEEMAQSFGNDANVYSASDLKLNANSVPSAGFDPRAVGVVFSLENGKRSEPFAGENGVFVIELQNKTIAPEIADYSVYKAQLQQTAQSRSYNVAEAIKENSNIEDKRYRFY